MRDYKYVREFYNYAIFTNRFAYLTTTRIYNGIYRFADLTS